MTCSPGSACLASYNFVLSVSDQLFVGSVKSICILDHKGFINSYRLYFVLVLCHDLCDQRILHGRFRHLDKISCRCISSIVSASFIQPYRIIKMAVFHAQLFRFVIHVLHESLNISCCSLCQCQCHGDLRLHISRKSRKHIKILLYRIPASCLKIQSRRIRRNLFLQLSGKFDRLIYIRVIKYCKCRQQLRRTGRIDFLIGTVR